MKELLADHGTALAQVFIIVGAILGTGHRIGKTLDDKYMKKEMCAEREKAWDERHKANIRKLEIIDTDIKKLLKRNGIK